MSASTKKLDLSPSGVYIAAVVVASLGKRPLAGLTRDQLEDLERSAEVLLLAAMEQVAERDRVLSRPRSAGNLRLAAAYGELTPAGVRSARARRAARARWSR